MPEATLKTSAPKPQNASWDDTGRWISETLWANCTVLGPCRAEHCTARTTWRGVHQMAHGQRGCHATTAVASAIVSRWGGVLDLETCKLDDEVMDEIQLQHLVPKIEEMNRCQVYQSPFLQVASGLARHFQDELRWSLWLAEWPACACWKQSTSPGYHSGNLGDVHPSITTIEHCEKLFRHS